MGRLRQNNPRISCRIDKKAAEILWEVLERIGYESYPSRSWNNQYPHGRKRPIGTILSRLIRWTDDWTRIIESFPKKPYVHNRRNAILRRRELAMEEERLRRKRDG